MTLRYRWAKGSLPPPGHYSLGIDLDGSAGRAWLKAGYGRAPVFESLFVADADALGALWAALDIAGLWADWPRPEHRSIGGSPWRLTATDGDRRAEIHHNATGSDGRSPHPFREAVEALVPDALWTDLRARRTALLKAS